MPGSERSSSLIELSRATRRAGTLSRLAAGWSAGDDFLSRGQLHEWRDPFGDGAAAAAQLLTNLHCMQYPTGDHDLDPRHVFGRPEVVSDSESDSSDSDGGGGGGGGGDSSAGGSMSRISELPPPQVQIHEVDEEASS